ncbi:serine hydrolase [Glycomyces niveus]|uniref:Serine hydrolase n=1 Tax=Glycomyces niveus TaxID=2820287 RepID=A0ABS3U764_9ACTN|nr:serine hydrolase [Glycomyces sp. NEAU-S30]MBO3734585.1 serine hydrolase [Glycomyces sp. NEAU-S30]
MTSPPKHAPSRRLWPFLVVPAIAVLIAAVIYVVDLSGDDGGAGGSAAGTLPGSQQSADEDSTLQPSEEELRLAAQSRLQADLDAAVGEYVAGLEDENFYASVAVDDAEFQLAYEGDVQHDTASIVKVEILTMVLEAYGTLDEVPDWLLAAAESMIKDSSNDATNQMLYGGTFDDGHDAIRQAHIDYGLANTNPNETEQWGKTQTTAVDQLRMLELALYEGVLDAEQVDYARSLMGDLADSQQWGVSAAAAEDETVWMKNGWDTRDAMGGEWVVNSIGVIEGESEEPIKIAILTGGSATDDEGIERVEALAEIIRKVVDTDPYA